MRIEVDPGETAGKSMKKLAVLAGAAVINAELLLLAGPLIRALRLPEHVLPFYVLGLVVLWFIVFAALLFLASSADRPLRKRVARALGESAIATFILCILAILPVARLG